MGKAQTITLHFPRNKLTVSVRQQDASITTQPSAKYISVVEINPPRLNQNSR